MTNQTKIPDDLQRAFHRLIYHLPDPLKDDDHTQQVILNYLKFGDEKLARHRIEIIKISFREKNPCKNHLKFRHCWIFTLTEVILLNPIYLG